MSPWHEPLEQLQKQVRHAMWLNVVFCAVVAVIALMALLIAGIVLRQHIHTNEQNIRRNQDTIVALCRELNQSNTDLYLYFLANDVPAWRLYFLRDRDCSSAKLRRRYGIK